MRDMMMSWQQEIFSREASRARFQHAPEEWPVRLMASRVGCVGFYCRAMHWTGRTLVHWGGRLQKRFAPPEVVPSYVPHHNR